MRILPCCVQHASAPFTPRSRENTLTQKRAQNAGRLQTLQGKIPHAVTPVRRWHLPSSAVEPEQCPTRQLHIRAPRWPLAALPLGGAVRSYVLAAASSRVPRRGSSAPLAASSPASRPASHSARRPQSQRPVQTSVGDAPSTCLLVRVTRARPDVSPSPGWPLCSFQSVSAASSRSPISAISFAYTVFATAQTFS